MELTLSRNQMTIQIKQVNLIEEYRFNESITFAKLMSFLLGQNLNEKITLVNQVQSPNDAETELVWIISTLISDYNSKVDELVAFLELQKTIIPEKK